MENTFWRKQSTEAPLFPDLLWSRPEQKSAAGKLLIVGGNLHGVSSPAEAYMHAQKAGAGYIRVLLPNSTKKTIGKIIEHVEFAPSTPSGGFAKLALSELLDLADWSDCTLLAGDLGRNSETSILLESFLQKNTGMVTVTTDTIDYFTANPLPLINRPNTLLVVSFGQLQKLAVNAKFTQAFTSNMDILRLVQALHDFTELYKVAIIVTHLNQIHVAINGDVISTKQTSPSKQNSQENKIAAHSAVWWLQNPNNPLQAIASSAFTILQ